MAGEGDSFHWPLKSSRPLNCWMFRRRTIRHVVEIADAQVDEALAVATQHKAWEQNGKAEKVTRFYWLCWQS
jgi:hypothetical protein